MMLRWKSHFSSQHQYSTAARNHTQWLKKAKVAWLIFNYYYLWSYATCPATWPNPNMNKNSMALNWSNNLVAFVRKYNIFFWGWSNNLKTQNRPQWRPINFAQGRRPSCLGLNNLWPFDSQDSSHWRSVEIKWEASKLWWHWRLQVFTAAVVAKR